jgi:FkbM family methyltransferase
MLKKLMIRIEDRMIGKMRWQRMFEMLHRIGIRGMNYYRGHTVQSSGEVWTMRHAFTQLRAKGVARPMVFDVGANTGQYLDVLLETVGETFDCHSFEPAAATFQPLAAHFKDKPFIRTVQLGVGKEDGHFTLYSNHEGSSIASFYPIYNLEARTALEQEELIPVRSLDSYCAEHGVSDIHFLKIDVEGAELDVLLGASRLLAERRIHYIQFEFGPNNMSSKTYMKDFFRVLKGYQICRILQDGIRPLPKYNEELEIPLVSNFLAIRLS